MGWGMLVVADAAVAVGVGEGEVAVAAVVEWVKADFVVAAVEVVEVAAEIGEAAARVYWGWELLPGCCATIAAPGRICRTPCRKY